MCDVGERPAVDEGEVVLQSLHEVGRDGLLQQRGHRPVRLQVARQNRLLVRRVADDDAAEALLQIAQAGGETEHRHHLRSHHDVESVLARIAVGHAAEPDDGLAQRAVVHVNHTAPGNAPHVEAELIALMDVIVDERREQVVRERDGGEVAGEVQIDVFHRDHLRVAAARGAALHAEHRPQGRLAQADDGLLADEIQRVSQAHRRGGLALARGSRRDGRDEHQLALGPTVEVRQVVERHFGLVTSVGLELLFRDSQPLAGELHDRPHSRVLRDFDVAGDGRLGIGRGRGGTCWCH